MIDQEMRQEREGIVKDLLVMLSSINEVNMVPTDSFVSVFPLLPFASTRSHRL